MGRETHGGFVGGAKSFRSLKASQRCPQHLEAFMMSMCFGGKILFRWDRTNKKSQTEWCLGGCTLKLLNQVYDLPQRPGRVPNYTKSSLSSPCCLVYAVSIKGLKEMQTNIFIKKYFRSFLPPKYNWWRNLLSKESQAWLVSLRFSDFNQIPLKSLKLLGNSQLIVENN